MFKAFASAFLAGAIGIAFAVPAATEAAQKVRTAHSSEAPMDRYFGRLAMSPLGVKNAITFASWHAGDHDANGTSVARSLAFAEDSVRDWERKFPKDRWLPRTLLAIKHVYGQCASPGCRKHEKRIGTWLLLRYPASTEARQVIGEAMRARPETSLVAARTP